MEWLERLNHTINYIETNLTSTIDYEEAAKIACCSTFHFQRMFSYIAGVPLSEYIRRRRMTLAAFELQTTSIKIVDLAIKYQYDSPTAFNRAFQSIHGVPPSSSRSHGIALKAYPPISFSISIKGDTEMNYRIEEKEAFTIIGVKEHMVISLEENFLKVPLFWQKVASQGIIPQLASLMDQPPFGILGVSTCMNGSDLDYYIAVASNHEPLDGMYRYVVPKTTWAIFECIGPTPSAIQEMQRRIITEWLPVSGYEYADAPDIEVYFDGDQQSPTYKTEIWLPVIKKQ